MRYFDYAATTGPSKSVMEVMLETMRTYRGNPSSLHTPGIDARKRYNRAKKTIAACLNAEKDNIVFTGSGTEASNLAIKGVAARHPKKTILTSAVEHPATKNACGHLRSLGHHVVEIPTDHEGYIDQVALQNALKVYDVSLVTLIHANNEIGTLQDVEAVRTLCRKHGALLHIDAVQSPLHIPMDMQTLDCDFASFSAHKFFGPNGIGFLYVKDRETISPILHGGKQEYNLRAGTENLAAIVGCEVALKEAVDNLKTRETHLKTLAEYFLRRLKEEHIDHILNGPPLEKSRLYNILNIGFCRQDGERLLFDLDQKGFALSRGSACSAGSIENSPVLQAIGVPEDYIDGSLRFSFSHCEDKEDIEALVQALKSLIA